MEAIDPAVEGAVLCMAETIRWDLSGQKMEEWTHQVELVNDTSRLKKEMNKLEEVVANVKGRAAESRPLAHDHSIVSTLKLLLYNVDDVVDELDYQHQVEGGTPHPVEADEADASRNTIGRSRSKAWDDFIITKEATEGNPLKAKCI